MKGSLGWAGVTLVLVGVPDDAFAQACAGNGQLEWEGDVDAWRSARPTD